MTHNHPLNGRPLRRVPIAGGYLAKLDTCAGCVCQGPDRAFCIHMAGVHGRPGCIAYHVMAYADGEQ